MVALAGGERMAKPAPRRPTAEGDGDALDAGPGLGQRLPAALAGAVNLTSVNVAECPGVYGSLAAFSGAAFAGALGAAMTG